MASSDFTPDELVTKHGKTYPVVGARLRLAHAADLAAIETAPISYEYGVEATVKARVIMGDANIQRAGEVPGARVFEAHGTATKARDTARMMHTLLELAETRAVARALRYAGFGTEYTGAEEVSHVSTNASFEDAPQKPVAASKPPSLEQRKKIRELAGELKALTGQEVNATMPDTNESAAALIRQMMDEVGRLNDSGAA